MIPIEKVKDIITKHDHLKKNFPSGSIDPRLFAKKSKEYSSLGELFQLPEEYVNFDNEKKDLLNMFKINQMIKKLLI